MHFQPTSLPGVFVVEIDPRVDDRGLFARTWCAEEFSRHGLNAALSQCSISHNLRRRTLRGLHFQAAPHAEAKLVRCTRGAAFDVAVDLRPDSSSYRKWINVELTAENRRALYIPEGFAHGFQTLADDTELLYMISVPYAAESSRGIRWNDPAVGVAWPLENPILSERDAALPLLGQIS